ncbi:Zn-dependent exopeptidase, partial [Ramicandelaber brevisporus]
EKPTVYLHCLLHAREWIAGATCAYIADTLVSSYKTNPQVTALLDRIRILMVPVANPDGLHYTFTMDRMLRKNLHGVDLNRNWPFMWGQIGSSSNPSDEIYHGPSAASEPETQSILRLLSSQKKIIGSIDFHSYGQDILRPFGHTTVPPPDEARLAAVSERMSSAIRKVRGTYYRTAPSGSGLYMTSGTFDDYVYATYKAYSLTIELSP